LLFAAIAFSVFNVLKNAQSMGSSLNAEVSEGGRVSIGAIVRDFD
jgi:hypothetical protein